MWSPSSSDLDLQPRCCLVGTSTTTEEQPQQKEAQLSALRRMLFRTGRPPLLSHELPQITLDPPTTVSAPKVDDLALRQLQVQPTGFTPYDRYLGVVRNVMADLPARKKSLGATCRLLHTARSFRYSPGDPYRADSPAVTAARKAGDCKAKALWLYDQLGDASVLYVIGKVSRTAKNSHAWLYWRWEGRWWILDPTNQIAPIAADSIAPGRYVPYYSFTQGATYRHPATYLLAAQANTRQTPSVASQSSDAPRRR
jgi:hypothetical protein